MTREGDGAMDTRLIDELEREQLEGLAKDKQIPEFGPGDIVRVHVKIPEEGGEGKEKRRERVQVFEGLVIRKKGGGLKSTFTVRKESHGVGVERTFFLHSPMIERIEVVRRQKPRRARLYFVREKKGKVRFRERR